MLTHKPPMSHLAVIKIWRLHKESSTFTQFELSLKHDFFQLDHLDTAVNNNGFAVLIQTL